ncbi:oligosaccharide flippase family protein [Caproicibacterium sp. BJN0003]|uniref:oligosaccharide flippase family protein n=1 Tax=Caproicibacterium sp. BJN0003 TaxID=2994078 RepID=UPI00224F1D8F|nr:oligosaccharide flippase family protein [Caproicibacterium sp. BJN0003]UZT81244.1 oligosaccharide flippase family protein [Caproicibacterium sp. BJN0003]
MKNSKHAIVKNTSMLYIMSIAKMIFPLITLPYLTRVLTVPCYGVVTYVKAIMQYMQLIVDFGFILSGTKDIVMAGQDQDKLNHEVGNVFMARILLGSFAFGCLCILIHFIKILNENALFTILSFVVVFLTCFLMDFYFRGIEKMEIITIRFVVMRGISTILTFFFVKSDKDIFWIPILDIIGSIAAVVLVWIELWKNNVRIRPQGISIAFAKIKESAVYFFSDMATTAFNAFNTVLVGIYFNTVEVAYWGVCMQIIGAIQSLYSPIADGIYPQMVRNKDIGIIKRIIKIFLPLIAAGCIFTFFVAKYALFIIGGSQYVDAAPILKLLIPVLFFSFFSILYGWPTLGAIGKEKETTMTTVVTACIQVLGLFLLIAVGKFNLITIAILRGITESILFFSRYLFYRKFKKQFKNADYNGQMFL